MSLFCLLWSILKDHLRRTSSHFFAHFLPCSVCSSPIGSRRSTRWSTAATAPTRGLWISALHRSLWRGYGLIWTGKMKPTAGGCYLSSPPASWSVNCASESKTLNARYIFLFTANLEEILHWYRNLQRWVSANCLILSSIFASLCILAVNLMSCECVCNVLMNLLVQAPLGVVCRSRRWRRTQNRERSNLQTYWTGLHCLSHHEHYL